jgi:hypothetical protein
MSISLLRRLLMKEAVKDTAGSSGIMSINKNIADKVEQQVQRYVNDAMRQGVDLDTLSPEQLKMIVQMNKPKPPRVIAGDSPEGKGIMEALLGKRGEVVDMAGKKLDTSQGIMGGKSVKELMDSGQVSKGARGMKKSKKVQDREMFQDANKRLKTDVDGIIKNIKKLSPMDAMKEANLVIGRKQYYKNLTPEESKKILKDTEDHIFERDIPEEDFANGGVAGLLGERPGYAIGNMVDQEDLGLGNLLNNMVEEDEYDFSDIEGQTAFVGLPEIIGIGTKIIGPMLKGGSASAILKNAAKEKLRQEIGKKIYKGIQKKINKPKYGTKGPTTTTTTKPGGGGNVISGGGGNKDFSVSGPNISANPTGKSNRASQARGYALHGADGGLANFANGGPARQNFAMGKRAFLKMLAGAGAGIAGLKSGLIGFGGKGAAKKAVTETVKQSASTPPPYFFKLAEKIKMLGDNATATTDRTIAKTLKSKNGKSTYLLEEDVTSGDTIIKKINKEGDEMITDVEIMELRKGEVVKGKDGKAIKTPDEYEEVTEANARIEGDTFNDPYYSDGIEIDDILREVDDIPVPKASGGIARMLGE